MECIDREGRNAAWRERTLQNAGGPGTRCGKTAESVLARPTATSIASGIEHAQKNSHPYRTGSPHSGRISTGSLQPWLMAVGITQIYQVFFSHPSAAHSTYLPSISPPPRNGTAA